MNIQSALGTAIEPRKSPAMSDAAKASAGSTIDPTKQASIAQSTVRAVQEALVKAGAAVVQPSAQVSVDSSKLARISGTEKAKDTEKLDTAKLDAIKAKIESGDFEIDYGMIASQLASQSVRRGPGGR
jgi:anti-sigma28 factor (negative regulator of flagellin synthesis)